MYTPRIDPAQQERNQVVRIVMAVLFTLFALLFLTVLQVDLLAVMQETWSHGVTHNNPLITAVIVIAVLLFLQYGLRTLLHLDGRWEGFSYLLSFMLLSLATDVDTTFHYHAPVKWAVILTLAVLMMIVIPGVGRQFYQDRKSSLISLLNGNLAMFVLSAVLCIVFTNHNAALHMELAAFRYADADKVESVSMVGRRSLETSPSLTALRNVALCREGRAGEVLFTLPQPYGAEGLMMGRYVRHDTSYGLEVYNRFVGTEPYGGESVTDFFTRLCRNDDTPFHRDLYIASLLLDRRLEDFSREFPPAAMGDTLAPRHYREAWLLARNLSQDAGADYHDAELEPLLDDFLAIGKEPGTTTVITANRRQLTYGNTYWAYYYRP